VNTVDQLTITGEFDSTATSISFKVSDFRNPPSLTSYSGITITTSTSNTNQKIDSASNVNFPVSTPATLDSSRIIISVADLQINKQTTYDFEIRIGLPLPSGSSIKLTFPSTITGSTSSVATGIRNLASDITESYDTGTKVLTLTNIVLTTTDYVSEGSYIQFTVTLITNPPTTQTSDSIVYASFDANGNGIETTTTGITVTSTPGSITSASVTPTNTTIRASTSYTFSFQTENTVPVGAILYIVFPSIITIADSTSTSCLSAGSNIDSTNGLCTVTSSRYLTITNGYGTTATPASTTISFAVSSITNYDTSKTSESFAIQTQDSGGNIIDSYQLAALTISSTPGEITALSIIPTSGFTGVQTSYTFQFTITQPILINSYIVITFPSEISVPDTSYSSGTCQTTIGLSGSLTCAFTSSQVLSLTNGFTSSNFLNGLLQFTIEGIQNPRSRTPTSTFNVVIYDSNGDSQYSITSGLTVAMSSASDFLSISLSPASQENGAINDYTFFITLSNTVVAGDFIRLTFPSEISVTSPTCVGTTNLATSLS
jgi:hypothetical protein